MKVEIWQQKVFGGEEWASVITETKALTGSQSRGVSKYVSK